jgi:hypothetical protein
MRASLHVGLLHAEGALPGSEKRSLRPLVRLIAQAE